SATVAPTSSRLRWPTRGWAEPAYRALDRIGTISEEDGRRLEQLGARRSALEVTGDTRYDSVAERAERFDRTRDPFARLAIAPAGAPVAGRVHRARSGDRGGSGGDPRGPVRARGRGVRGGRLPPCRPALGARAGRVRRPRGRGAALAHEPGRGAVARAGRRGRA